MNVDFTETEYERGYKQGKQDKQNNTPYVVLGTHSQGYKLGYRDGYMEN